MSSISLDRLLFDIADAASGPLVGAALIGGTTGGVITDSVAGKLDVTIANASIVVTATALDIRALTNADVVTVEIDPTANAVKITDGTDTLAIDASGYIGVNVQNSVTVTATALDIRALTQADEVTVFQGGTWTVAATISAPAGAIVSKTTGVTATAAKIPATPLAARQRMLIQNKSTTSIYIGGSTLTVANGVEITKGGNLEVEVGPGQEFFAMAGTAGPHDVRTLERA